MSTNELALMVEVTRGGAIESRHFGSAVIADAAGPRWAIGEPDAWVFPRSAVKPIQALPLVESGAADRFGVSDAELAVACGSHNGEPVHVDVVSQWLQRLGLRLEALGCGAHWPTLEEAARDLATHGATPSAIHNNCSGKHVGFLATALHLRESLSGYTSVEHPVQQRWLNALAELAEVDLTGGPQGFDGCTIPSRALPLARLAVAYARFSDPAWLSGARRQAAERIETAIRAQPYLIAGKARACTRIVSATRGRVLVKMGAEGVFVGWIPELRVGLSLKISDGAARAAEVALVAIIRRALGFSHPLAVELDVMQQLELRGCLGARVGEVRPAAALLLAPRRIRD
jgi:L-asparaginase II